jgi:hypothetical protein
MVGEIFEIGLVFGMMYGIFLTIVFVVFIKLVCLYYKNWKHDLVNEIKKEIGD